MATPLLDAARAYDRSGALREAAGGYEAAVAEAERCRDPWALSEALRRLAVIRHRMDEFAVAYRLAERSCAVAAEAGLTPLMAEGINTLGGFHLVEERFAEAETELLQALDRSPSGSQLRGRIEQNLGTVRSSQGDHTCAMAHYERSLAAFEAAGDEHSCAIAHHNLGVMSKEQRRWVEAESHFRLAFTAADRSGDTHLVGLVLLNRSEVLVALGRLTPARQMAEAATKVLDEVRASAELGDAYRILGVILRESGNLKLAQARLRLAAELSASAGSPIGEAEALRDLGLACALAGEADEALRLLIGSTRTLARLKPCLQPEQVLDGDYPAAVRAWGDLLRIQNPTALAHAERVGAGAGAVAGELGCDFRVQARIRLAGYLHGVSSLLIEAAELPWGVAETRRACGECCGKAPQEPGAKRSVEAQVIAIVDRYDCATMPPPDGQGMMEHEARVRMEADRHSWEPAVYEAFTRWRSVNGDSVSSRRDGKSPGWWKTKRFPDGTGLRSSGAQKAEPAQANASKLTK